MQRRLITHVPIRHRIFYFEHLGRRLSLTAPTVYGTIIHFQHTRESHNLIRIPQSANLCQP